MNEAYDIERTILLIVIWGLILESLTLIYFYTSAQTWRFEFQYTMILFIITLATTVAILFRVFRRARAKGAS